MKNYNNNLLIQIDFDNTISFGHISEKLHQHFQTPQWTVILNNYKSNIISVEESNILSFKNCLVPYEQIKNYIESNIEFREGIEDFINDLKNITKLKIVSSGVDFWLSIALNKLQINLNEIEIICGKSTFTRSGINVQYFDSTGENIKKNFKFHYTKKFKEQGYKIIYIGDSETDLKSALISDYVFATDELQKILELEQISFFPFHDFKSVNNKIQELL